MTTSRPYPVLLVALLVTITVVVSWLVFNIFVWSRDGQFPSESQSFPNSNFSAQSLVWRVGYDSLGRIAKSIDPAGRPTSFKYSPLTKGQAQSITVTPPEGKDVTWQFDQDGLLASMKDGKGKVNYRYDKRKRLTAIERKGTPAISYGYDDAGRVSELRVGGFYHIAKTYDFLGRISSINTPAGTIKYEYRTGQGMVVRSLPNGVKTYIKRQADGELKEIVHGFFKQPNDNRYTVLANYTYEHGPDGRIVAIGENSAQGQFIRRFTYDLMGRLIHATGQGGQEFSYEYDKFGNRTKATDSGSSEQTCTYDWAGRLVTVNGDSTQYDANGNLTGATIKSAKRNYHYHSDGKISEVQLDDGTAEYRYDGFGRLISRSSSAGETNYIPDPLSGVWQPLVIEKGGSKTLVIWDGNTPLALIQDGQVEWLLHDHLGSVRLAANARGKIRETYDYDPFGVPLEKKNVSAPVPGFAGLFWDEQAGGYLTMARLYNPHLGSFLQPDPQKRIPTADANNLSLFAYCGGDPVNFVDVNGAEPEPVNAEDWWTRQKIWWGTFGNSFVQNWAQTRDEGFAGIRDFWVNGGLQAVLTGNVILGDPSPGTWADQAGGYSKSGKLLVQGILGATLATETVLGAPVIVGALTKGSKSILIFTRNSLGRTAAGNISRSGTSVAWKGLEKGMSYLANLNTSLADAAIGNVVLNDAIRTTSLKFVAQKVVAGTVAAAIVSSSISPFFLLNKKQIPVSTIPDFTDEKFPEAVMAYSNNYRYKFEKMYTRAIHRNGDNALFFRSRTNSLNSSFNISTSPVGGIALGKAGALIDGLGSLKGVQLDENGNLILVGEDDKDIELPPLRLDDLVTVFRSVYINGEGPTVTIDPNPENPEKSAMIIRHSEATDSTYVGWVLYQADRLMKGYGQGVDNITGKDIKSKVLGYDKVIDTVYFGGVDPLQRQRGGVWERFWIVPAEATRFQGDRQKLTLFDVPLKVNTQKMKWVGNELVDDLSGKSSSGANAFTSWFTKNYDGIAEEQYLKPPDETGVEEAVPVFAELQRVALMTAIAEKLRDQGVPMPFWMYDYEVRKIPFEKFTPGLEVKRQKREGSIIRTARIFGGVELSAEDKVVKTYSSNFSVSKVPPGLKAAISQNIRLANQLEKTVSDVVSPVAATPLAVKSLQQDKKAYKVTAVPGANTLALSPCRLNEPDLVVPLPGNRGVSLTRQYNSFFSPRGLWGKCWTLDLPRLQKVRVPFSRQSGQTSYVFAHVLLTPLNSVHAYFLNGRAVKNFSNPQSPDIDSNSLFRSLTKAESRFLNSGSGSTLMLLQKSGQEWHFNEAGQLVAVKDGSQTTQYEREKGKIIRIVSQYGDTPPAEILLEYDGGKLSKATGKSGAFPSSKTVTVTYSYDDQGLLTGVSTDEGMVGYRYKREKVSAVTWQGTSSDSQPEVIREYEYDARGRLLTEKDGNSTIVYNISPRQKGIVFSASSPGMGGDDDEDRIGDKKHAKHAAGSGGGGGDGGSGDSTEVIMHYDQQMRPIKSVDPNGIVTTWSYPDSCNAQMTITDQDQQSITVTDSLDERSRTIKVNGSPWIKAKFNEGGQLVGLSEFGQSILHQEWRLDGQLRRITTADRGTSFEYDENGVLTSIFLHPANAGGRFDEWQETKVDQLGRPIEVKDYRGLHVVLRYDESGGIAAVLQQTPGGNGYQGFEIKRSENGQIDSVKSPWGNTSYRYGKDESIEEIVAERGGQSASITFSNSRVSEMTGFDGGRTVFSYLDDDLAKRLLASVKCPDGLGLRYSYSADGLLSTVDVENQRRVRLEYDDQGRVVTYKLEELVMQ